MKRFLSALTVAIALLPGLAHAATSGDLLKASGDAVYYFGANNKRYAFPTARTYASWYADFSQVKTIGDAELAMYPLGGNVTYRPGVRLVKVTTDPRTYAVGPNGELRWITTEALAVSLYGADWNTKVDDLPDAFFVNYRIGAPITQVSDFAPSTETGRAASINVDKSLATTTYTPPPPPAPAPLPGTENEYRTSLTIPGGYLVVKGGNVTLRADTAPTAGLSTVKIFVNNVLLSGCGYTPCTATYYFPYEDATSYPARVEATWITGQTATATTTISLSDPLTGITMSLEKTELRPNTAQFFTVTVDPQLKPSLIDVYVDGIRISDPTCINANSCTLRTPETSPLGTVHRAYARIEGDRGAIYTTPVQTYTVRSNDSPRLTITPDKTTIYVNETLNVYAQALDDDGIAWTEIWDGALLVKRCQNTVNCLAVVGPYATPRTFTLTATTQDALGGLRYATSTVVTVR